LPYVQVAHISSLEQAEVRLQLAEAHAAGAELRAKLEAAEAALGLERARRARPSV
jgi:hypothetical protein